jgi:hypothetical protein
MERIDDVILLFCCFVVSLFRCFSSGMIFFAALIPTGISASVAVENLYQSGAAPSANAGETKPQKPTCDSPTTHIKSRELSHRKSRYSSEY